MTFFAPKSIRDDRGLALIGAVGLMIIFVMLGTAYVGYMVIELDTTGYDVNQVRARQLAEGGIRAAIGEIAAALESGDAVADPLSFTLVAYRPEGGELAEYPQTVNVAVSDESARVNINHAPALVLRALGLSEDAVNAVMEYRGDGKNRLASVDALLTRDLIDTQAYDRLNRDLFTVYTVSDRRQPHSYINVNSAPPRVLSAIFAINMDEARALAAKRPFLDWRDVLQKVGREPTSFNVEVPQFAPRDMPRPLSLSSRCYRLRSEVVLDMPGQDGRSARAGVEAVVYFHEDGSHAIRYWRPRGFIEEVEPSTGGDAGA